MWEARRGLATPLTSSSVTGVAVCVHRGVPLGAELCQGCRGAVRIKTFACALHGACTLAHALADVACCAACPDFQAASGNPPPEPRRGMDHLSLTKEPYDGQDPDLSG